ncbi:hypothetical protein ACIGHF_15460 [Stenotrophomonas sp. NPDC077464]|uniref:hypothetical protein n=1 Tax=unclassified Stenotrophomonas TaxID=196198 RepID=UPI0037CFCAC2
MRPMNATPPRSRLAAGIARSLRVACGSLLLATTTAPAWAGCDTTAPTTGQTVTCTAQAPSPQATPIASVPGSSNVTVNVQTGAQLGIASGAAIALDGGSGHRIDNSGSITSASGVGILTNAATTVVNRGVISGSTAGIIFGAGAGADRLDMLAGSISSSVCRARATMPSPSVAAPSAASTRAPTRTAWRSRAAPCPAPCSRARASIPS